MSQYQRQKYLEFDLLLELTSEGLLLRSFLRDGQWYVLESDIHLRLELSGDRIDVSREEAAMILFSGSEPTDMIPNVLLRMASKVVVDGEVLKDRNHGLSID